MNESLTDLREQLESTKVVLTHKHEEGWVRLLKEHQQELEEKINRIIIQPFE